MNGNPVFSPRSLLLDNVYICALSLYIYIHPAPSHNFVGALYAIYQIVFSIFPPAQL